MCFSVSFLILMKLFQGLMNCVVLFYHRSGKLLLLMSQSMLWKPSLVCYIQYFARKLSSFKCLYFAFSWTAMFQISSFLVIAFSSTSFFGCCHCLNSELYNAFWNTSYIFFFICFHNREMLLLPLEERLKKWFTEVRLRCSHFNECLEL